MRRAGDEEEMSRGAQGLAHTTPHHLPHPHHHNTPPHPHHHISMMPRGDATTPGHHQATNKRATTTSASPAGQRDDCAGWYLLPLGQHGAQRGTGDVYISLPTTHPATPRCSTCCPLPQQHAASVIRVCTLLH